MQPTRQLLAASMLRGGIRVLWTDRAICRHSSTQRAGCSLLPHFGRSPQQAWSLGFDHLNPIGVFGAFRDVEEARQQVSENLSQGLRFIREPGQRQIGTNHLRGGTEWQRLLEREHCACTSAERQICDGTLEEILGDVHLLAQLRRGDEGLESGETSRDLVGFRKPGGDLSLFTVV